MAFQTKLREACQPQSNGNLEFSWIEREYKGMNIMPKLRQQEGNSCVFHAMCSGTEMACRRAAAAQNPPSTCDIEFNAASLVEDYERRYHRKIDDEPGMNLPLNAREDGAINIFSTTGVLATSTGWDGERRVKLARCRTERLPQFDKIANLILQGNAVVGSFPSNADFLRLRPGQIYRFFGSQDKSMDYTHMVLFVGFGYEGGPSGERYLIFVNSYGDNWGDEGFGRVYFEEVFKDRLYVLSADAPKPNVSTSSAPKRKLIQDPDDHSASPAQRLRVDGDD